MDGVVHRWHEHHRKRQHSSNRSKSPPKDRAHIIMRGENKQCTKTCQAKDIYDRNPVVTAEQSPMNPIEIFVLIFDLSLLFERNWFPSREQLFRLNRMRVVSKKVRNKMRVKPHPKEWMRTLHDLPS